MSPHRESRLLAIVTGSLLIGSLPLIPFEAASAQPVRVALVGTHVGEAAGGVVALAEARLSGHKGLEVLDRQNVGRILQEHKLIVAGLVDASVAIKVGQLCSVDLFALVEQSPDGKDTLACIIYDAATSVRLCDESLASDRIEAIADAVVACVDLAARKRSASSGKLRTLTVIGVRNADLPRSLDTQCQSLAMLLERRLIHSGQIALLERTRLAWLKKEKDLSAAPPDQQLLSSLLQADLEFSRHADGVRATLLVTDPALVIRFTRPRPTQSSLMARYWSRCWQTWPAASTPSLTLFLPIAHARRDGAFGKRLCDGATATYRVRFTRPRQRCCSIPKIMTNPSCWPSTCFATDKANRYG